MVAFNVVGRFRHQNDLRAYRRELIAEIGRDFALQLLPNLIDIPLPIVGADGQSRDLGAVLRETGRVTLSGSSGSGRQLALQQVAHHWVTVENGSAPVPVLISLPRLDDGRSPPAALIAVWTQSADQVAEPKAPRGALARLRWGGAHQETEDQPPHWMLLIHGWEELSPERREAWQAALLDAPQQWPEMPIAVTLPNTGAAWSSFVPLTIATPTPALLANWIEGLAPPEQRAAILAALTADGSLHALGGRLFEAALLAWLAPRSGLPATRAELYERALIEILDMPTVRLAHATAIAELQLLAAYDEWPSFTIPGLLEPVDGDAPRFFHPQPRRYLAARQLVAEGRYDLLYTLDQAERDELALLIATMLVDPTPLYLALWGTGQSRSEDALALGRCLCERAPSSPGWTLRVIGALALLARSGAAPLRIRAYEVLIAGMPALDAILPLSAAASDRVQQFLLRLFDALPTDLVVPRMELLVYDGATPESLAWELVDRLVARPAMEDDLLPDPPTDRAALARWSYIQVLRGPRSRQLLGGAVAAALPALAESAAGDDRRRHMAEVLLGDRAFPTAARVAALALVTGSDHPDAIAVIERAAYDESMDVRQNALEVLSDRDPQRAYAILSRVALDETIPWDTRLNAISRLGDHLALGAGAILERLANDPAMPLYVRMQAVAALGRPASPAAVPAAGTGSAQAAAMSSLVMIAGDANCHPEVRGSAARRLGTDGHHTAIDDLLWLLGDPATPTPLAEAICDGLGALGDRLACAPLLHTLATATANVTLTLAVVRALGALGEEEAVEPLSRLLGPEALDRLQRGPHQRLLQTAAEACLDAPDLPWTMALRLASAIAEGATPADRPTTFAEFLINEAARLRAQAATSLAAIGGNAARAALLTAVLNDASAGATIALIAALAEAEGQESAETLGNLLGVAQISPPTRWAVVWHLVDHPAGEEVMRRMLARTDVDPFTRGALAEGLGQRGDPTVIPLLRQIADDRNNDEHLRSQAVLGLGLLDQPATEPALMRLVGDHTEDDRLRGLAAQHLPAGLSDDGRRLLRDMLRRERVPTPIAVGAMRALGRARDREALPLLLRYCQDEAAEVAQAAIGAMADLSDRSVAPDLVRITQNPNADRAVRLEAIGALLQIDGAEFRPLLQAYLDQGALPLRLLALEHLIAMGGDSEELMAMFANRTWPPPLRHRLIERLGNDPQAAPVLLDILEDNDDDHFLRCLAAEALGRARHMAARPTLIGLAERADTPGSLRLRCINAISSIGGIDSWLVLSSLAESSARMPIARQWAALALRHTGLRSEY